MKYSSSRKEAVNEVSSAVMVNEGSASVMQNLQKSEVLSTRVCLEHHEIFSHPGWQKIFRAAIPTTTPLADSRNASLQGEKNMERQSDTAQRRGF
ncbi:hypothetical protein CEXT_456971 [Caerostris extrusa]|uniref:Uncharacterized protein n=1 Tax=Caerostris extrusa TaxID=172846 RepID=A0AAV4MHX7_CAEEX|nr:hypothetical protein CEXT_456971 [Caerostris extrusa]